MSLPLKNILALAQMIMSRLLFILAAVLVICPRASPLILSHCYALSHKGNSVVELQRYIGRADAALKDQGFSTVWRTGLLCNEPAVKEYFGVGADDDVTAFVYTGSSPCDMPTRKPIDIEPLLRFES